MEELRLVIMGTKSYKELILLDTFEQRYEYLRLTGCVGQEVFGHDRYVNQGFYTSPDWKSLRNEIIIRDDGCDLGIEDRPIYGKIYIHHINPITLEELERSASALWDPDNLICVSFTTHQAIHYGDASILPQEPIERYPNDTCPWKV